jgi:myosin heavy subunit
MKNLQQLLGNTECCFVRCIKPNRAMKPHMVDYQFIAHQLRSLGLVQTAQVLRVGLPTRVKYGKGGFGVLSSSIHPKIKKAFYEAFGKDHNNSNSDSDSNSSGDAALAAALLWVFDIPKTSYRLGKTRAFFKSGEGSELVFQMLETKMAEQGESINTKLESALTAQRRANEAAQHVQELIEVMYEFTTGIIMFHVFQTLILAFLCFDAYIYILVLRTRISVCGWVGLSL